MQTNPPSKSLLLANVCALMRVESPSVDAIKQATGIGRGTAQRIHAGDDNVRFDTLTKIADAFKIQPWQLLVEGLDPDNLPQLDAEPMRWPFKSVDREAVTSLVGTVAQQVENGLLVALAAAGVSPKVAPQVKPRRAA